MRHDLRNQTEIAEELGTDRKTIAGLAKALGLTPKLMGMPGRAKGYDPSDIKRFRKALGLTGRKTASTTETASVS